MLSVVMRRVLIKSHPLVIGIIIVLGVGQNYGNTGPGKIIQKMIF